MIRRNSLLWRNVAEHSILLVIVSAHSLVSLTFFLQTRFVELKLQKNCIFQQTARDRAILGVLYASGIRVSECAHLRYEDIDLRGRVLIVRQGKGGNDRFGLFRAPGGGSTQRLFRQT